MKLTDCDFRSDIVCQTSYNMGDLITGRAIDEILGKLKSKLLNEMNISSDIFIEIYVQLHDKTRNILPKDAI